MTSWDFYSKFLHYNLIDGDEGGSALINFPLKSICVNNQTYQIGEYQPGTRHQESDKNAKAREQKRGIYTSV